VQYIEPGKLMQGPLCESFNGRIRVGCFNTQSFEACGTLGLSLPKPPGDKSRITSAPLKQLYGDGLRWKH
jgi:hypothetical protein